jgi:hypothetical protein
MPDWKKVVRKRMAVLKLQRDLKEEVTAELAAHTEEVYEQARADGLSGRAAIRIVLQEVGSWSDLSREIGVTRSTEAAMNQRTKTLWLPAMAVLFGIGLSLVLLGRAPAVQQLIWMASIAMLFCVAVSEAGRLNERTRRLWLPGFASMSAAGLFVLAAGIVSDPSRFTSELGLRPQSLLRVESGPGRTFYISWVIAHLFFGAVGAYMSRRAGGTRGARILAGMFPALAMFVLCGIVIPISAFAQHNLFVERHPMTLVFGTVIWAVIPGIALMVGAAPFLREAPRVEVILP